MKFAGTLARNRIREREQSRHCRAVRVVGLVLPLAMILSGCGESAPAPSRRSVRRNRRWPQPTRPAAGMTSSG